VTQNLKVSTIKGLDLVGIDNKIYIVFFEEGTIEIAGPLTIKRVWNLYCV